MPKNMVTSLASSEYRYNYKGQCTISHYPLAWRQYPPVLSSFEKLFKSKKTIEDRNIINFWAVKVRKKIKRIIVWECSLWIYLMNTRSILGSTVSLIVIVVRNIIDDYIDTLDEALCVSLWFNLFSPAMAK